MPSSKNHKIPMSEEEIRSFVDLSNKKRSLLEAKNKLDVNMKLVNQQLREIDREQDGWLASFAFKNGHPLNRAKYLRFDLHKKEAFDNECDVQIHDR